MTESKFKFKIGDIVYSRHFGRGVIVDIDEERSPVYPIKVDWEDGAAISWYGYIFTKEGRFNKDNTDPKYDIIIERRLKEMKDDVTFKVGDRVYAPFHGYGTVIKARNDNSVYPIVVKWDNSSTQFVEAVNSFTKDGYLSHWTKTDYTHLSLVNESKKEEEMGKDTTLNVNNTSRKDVECSPINPSHYRVEGIPEAIDIMEHLMTKEQLKGFLWGNIIKYAYRYGRKGDEHDTAGKIEWYANRLKEACEKERKQ